MGPPVDKHGLEIIGTGECRDKLSHASVGRVGLISGGQPLVLPMNYTVSAGHAVLRTTPETILWKQAGENARAAFEIDGFDLDYHTGWSVLVLGVLERIEDMDTAALQHVHVRPWRPGPAVAYVRLRIDSLTGRRVVAGAH